jgi:hypothetical protein
MMHHARGIVVYEHKAWLGYLVSAILPEATAITAEIGEHATDVLSRLPGRSDVFLFHLDLTMTARLPLDRADLLARLRERSISVRNAQVVDISKRSLQVLCLAAGLNSMAATVEGDPNELLIVKTNYNFHGTRENELGAERLRLLGYAAPAGIPAAGRAEYRILPRAHVPPAAWSSHHWAVERYVANRAHLFYRAYVAGDALAVSRVHDPALFKKMPEGITRESHLTTRSAARGAPLERSDFHRVAALCAAVADAAHLDYGALDIVADDDGALHTIDMNTTPYWGDGGHPDLLRYLGDGLWSSHDA